MKKTLIIFIMTIAFAVGLAAQEEETYPPAGQGSLGMLFQIDNFPLTFSPYDDGYLAGAGVKILFTDSLRLRALLQFTLDTEPEAPAESNMNLAAAMEYHFKPDIISPYVGGLISTRWVIDQAFALDFCFGGLGGVEVQVYRNFSVYGEYSILFTIDDNGFDINLGNNARVGAIIYF